MSDDAERPRRIFIGFVVVLALLAFVSFAIGLHRALRTSLRGDEVITLYRFWRVQTLGVVRHPTPYFLSTDRPPR